MLIYETNSLSKPNHPQSKHTLIHQYATVMLGTALRSHSLETHLLVYLYIYIYILLTHPAIMNVGTKCAINFLAFASLVILTM